MKGILESDGSALLESTIKARAGSRAEVGGLAEGGQGAKGKKRNKSTEVAMGLGDGMSLSLRSPDLGARWNTK